MKKLNKILLIDDDDLINFIHKKIISVSGCANEIVYVRSAMDGIEHLKTTDTIPDLILLDLNMPAIDGWGFLEQRKKININPSPKIIILTTSVNPDDRIKASKIKEVDDYLNKPLNPETITEVINRHFEHL